MDTEESDGFSLNASAIELLEEMFEMIDILDAEVTETKLGPIVVDLGVNVHAGYLAGQYLSQICLGGLAEVTIQNKQYGELFLPSVQVVTDFPVEATLGSQYAGWSIENDGYRAMASGPARILAKKPKNIYEKISLNEQAEEALIVLESEELPNDDVLQYIASKCQVSLDSLYVLVAPTTCIAGTIQISARSVETAIHKLFDLGMDVKTIIAATGSAPISPVHYGNADLMMGRTNDMLIYGSEIYLQVDTDDEKSLLGILQKATSDKSKNYGALFYDVVKSVKSEFYKIDPSIFAPAKLLINSVQSGKYYSFGKVNSEMLSKSIAFIP